LIEPITPEIKEDMINHGEKITNLMKKINTYFMDNKEILKNKIQTAISSQKSEGDRIEEEQLRELTILRTYL
jgi:hypothetical protein